MVLHTAVRGILKMQGRDFVNNPAFINSLDDFNAFEQNGAFKNVLRIIISDGYAGKLLAIGSWNLKAQGLTDELVRSYAVDPTICAYVIESLAYGLGYIGNEPSYSTSQTVPNSSSSFKSSKFDKRQKDLADMDEEDLTEYIFDVQNYLDSIIEIKGDWERELGARFSIGSVYTVDHNGWNCIKFRIEIDGKISIRDYGYIEFIGVVYDNRGKIIGRCEGNHFKTNQKKYEVIEAGYIENSAYRIIANVSRIVFYWNQS